MNIQWQNLDKTEDMTFFISIVYYNTNHDKNLSWSTDNCINFLGVGSVDCGKLSRKSVKLCDGDSRTLQYIYLIDLKVGWGYGG